MRQTKTLMIVIGLFFTLPFACFGQDTVSVYSQPDSPLQISNVVLNQRLLTDNNGTQLTRLSFTFTLQNVSDRPIRAYTIRQFKGDFDKNAGTTVFSYLPKTSTYFKPGQIRNEDGDETKHLKASNDIKLAVDFVEFADGSTWGKDVSQSAKQSAGVNAGIKLMLESFKKINERNGIEAFIKASNETQDLLPPENESEIWKRGFKTGVNIVKNHIKRAYEKEGIKNAEIELQKFSDPLL